MKKLKVPCPYCGDEAKLKDSSIVYGKSYGKIWICEPCNAYVGVHKNSPTFKPLGTLADAPTREWRKKAHAAFDPLWKGGKMTRDEAYQWLSDCLWKTRDCAHIGKSTAGECRHIVEEVFKQFGKPKQPPLFSIHDIINSTN